MNFENLDITRILKASIPKRFQDIPPFDFEDFIAFLFIRMGYSVDQTPYSGDFGADIVVSKNAIKTAVQVKRFNKNNKVAVADVNQIIGAKNYYKCDSALIITTSDFSKASLKLAESTGVETWAWNELLKNVSNTFLDGKEYYDFFSESYQPSKEAELIFSIIRAEINVELKKGDRGTIIYFQILNKSDSNKKITLEFPQFINSNSVQYEAVYRLNGEFSSGMIYAGNIVEAAFIFNSEKISKIYKGDKLIVKYYEEDSIEIETRVLVFETDYENPEVLLEQKRLAQFEQDNKKKILKAIWFIVVFIIFLRACS